MKKTNKMKCDTKKELAIGRKIEMEHASLFPKKIQKKMAGKIAEQHIAEFPCYYTKGLLPLEAKFKKMMSEKSNRKLKMMKGGNKNVK